MTMTIKNNYTIEGIVKGKIDRYEANFERAIVDLKAELQIDTKAGKDIEGGAFKPYSPKYAKYKESKGRNTSVDLTFTGTMLSSMVSSVQRVGNNLVGKIGFTDDTKKVQGNLDLGRKFFGLTQEKLNNVKKKLGE